MSEQAPRGDLLRKAQEELYIMRGKLKSAGTTDKYEQDALTKLLQIVEQINAELDVERVLNLAADRIIEVFQAEQVFVIGIDRGGKLKFQLAVHFKGQTIANPEIEVSHAVITEVASRRVPVLAADATKDDRFAQFSSVHQLQLHSVMAAPLIAGEQLLGVIYADNRLISGAFNERSLRLLGLFSNHVAIALRNAQLFRELLATRSELALSERFRAIGEVAMFIAHEIKNPLLSIRLLADALQEKWQDDVFRTKALTAIPDAVQRLDNAVNGIMNYARPTDMVKSPVTVAKIIHAALTTLEPVIKAQSVKVSQRLVPDLPAIMADGQRMAEVFVNLIKNSLEAMESCDSDMRNVRLIAQRLDETHTEILVEDTGPGIPPEKLATIFEPFRTGKKLGSGIGLAFCEKIIREHGGSIVAENIPGGGARFRMHLPMSGT